MQKIVVFVSTYIGHCPFLNVSIYLITCIFPQLGITDQCSQEQTAWVSAGAIGVHRASHVLCGWHKVFHPAHSIYPFVLLYFHGYHHLLLCLDTYGIAYIETRKFSQASWSKDSHERREGKKCSLFYHMYQHIQIECEINDKTICKRLGSNGFVRVASPWRTQRRPRDSLICLLHHPTSSTCAVLMPVPSCWLGWPTVFSCIVTVSFFSTVRYIECSCY